MTVVETLGPVSWWVLRRRRATCPCGRLVVLRRSWTSRWLCLVQRERIHHVSTDQLGRARVITSSLTARLMDAMLGRGGVDPQLEQLLLRFFFHDEHIRFVCRKNLFQWVQDQATLYQAAWEMARARRCPSAAFVPTDPYAARLLGCWKAAHDPQAAAGLEIIEHNLLVGLGVWRNAAWSWLAGSGLLAGVLVRVARQGMVRRLPARRAFRVALHNHHGISRRPQDVRFAECLVDGQRLRKQDVLLLLSGARRDLKRQRQSLGDGIASTRLFGPPVPLPYLVRLVPRLLRAVGAFWGVRGTAHAVLRWRAAGAIRYGLLLEAVLSHYAIGVLLSTEESFSHHIVETVVLNHWGARTAWIPESVASRDYNMTYLHYDLLPIQGHFPATLHDGTWSRRMAVKPVGMLWNDGTSHAEMASASEPVRAIIADAKRLSRKILAAFAGSYSAPDEFLVERYRRFLAVLAALAAQDPRLLILLKPKANADTPRHLTFLFQPPFWDVLEPGIRQGTIRLLDPREGLTCAAQDLIAAADAVVSTSQYAAFNSVWAEALLLGKPSYSFTPSEFRRALSAPGLFDEWLFDDEDALLAKLQAALREPPARPQVEARIRWLFDPYNDGRALERFRDAVLSLAGA